MPVNEEKLLPAAEEPKLLAGPPPRNSHQAVRRPRHLWLWIALGLIVLAGLFLFGYMRHRRVENAAIAAAAREKNTLPIVNVMQVKPSSNVSDLLLPGTMTPLMEASIYARAAGYVSKRYVDIGDRVRQGQLLAEIEAPELDQQVAQGEAAVAQAQEQVRQAHAALEDAKSQLELATITWNRYKVLADKGAIARQDADTQNTNYKTSQANVNSAAANISAAEQNVRANRANLERLRALQGFKQIRAPFAGVVTLRTFDIGALVSASGASQGMAANQIGGFSSSASGGGSPGSSTASSGELFRIAQITTLRLLINVPQESAPAVAVGQPAHVFIENFDETTGRITRTANAIDPNTRTLLTEVQVPNANQKLLPGMYSQVQLTQSRANPPLLIPGDSIKTTADGLSVAVLRDLNDRQKKQLQERNDQAKKTAEAADEEDSGKRQDPSKAKSIHIVRVQVGRDYGQQIEITRGLNGGEYVVMNPGDEVEEGATVYPVAAPKAMMRGNETRKGPSEQKPGTSTAERLGQADSGGRGASTPRGGASQGGGQNGGQGSKGSSQKEGSSSKQ